MNTDTLRQYATDPLRFLDDLLIHSAHGVKRFGDCMADFQRLDFQAMAPSLLALARGEKPLIGRAWFERTKGASKDSDLACCLLWLMAFSNRPLRIQVGAFDAEQADEIRIVIRQLLRLDGPVNALLASVTTVKGSEITNSRTDALCSILTTDSRGSHGARPDLVIVNELSHIGNQEFAETLLDNADKVPGGMVIVATNAGFLDSWQFRWHELARHSARWHFSAYTSPAPWIDPEALDESRQRNSATRFARLWCGQWVRGTGDALDQSDIEAAITQSGPLTEANVGRVYTAGLDLATKRDHAALVVLESNPATRRVRVASCQTWKPPIDQMHVEATTEETARRFGACVHFDPSQAMLLVARLQAAGIHCEEMAFTGPNCARMASVVLQMFRERRIDLFPDDRLVGDLGRLVIVEKSFGHKLEASHDPNAGHADSAFALAIALPAAAEAAQSSSEITFESARGWRTSALDRMSGFAGF